MYRSSSWSFGAFTPPSSAAVQPRPAHVRERVKRFQTVCCRPRTAKALFFYAVRSVVFLRRARAAPVLWAVLSSTLACPSTPHAHRAAHPPHKPGLRRWSRARAPQVSGSHSSSSSGACRRRDEQPAHSGCIRCRSTPDPHPATRSPSCPAPTTSRTRAGMPAHGRTRAQAALEHALAAT